MLFREKEINIQKEETHPCTLLLCDILYKLFTQRLFFSLHVTVSLIFIRHFFSFMIQSLKVPCACDLQMQFDYGRCREK